VTEVIGMPAVGVSFMHAGGGDAEVLLAALEERTPDFIAGDAGSTDAGPAFLGSGKGMTHRSGLKKAFEAILPIVVSRKIPLIVGSCGMAGTREHLDEFRGIVEEVAREQGLHFKLGLIDSEQDKSFLKANLREGRIQPLGPVPELTEDDIDRATHIVGMQGTEPVVEALNRGADVVLAGRISDAAMFAAVPVMRGIPLAQAWHMAKVIDHGFTNVEPVEGVRTSVFGIAGDDSFTIEATHPRGQVNAMRVAHATVYENSSPFHLYEPPGMLDISSSHFEQDDPRTVTVTGSEFVAKPYTIKLEGAERVGYRTITIGGIRDPELIEQVDSFLESCTERVVQMAAAQGITPEQYKFFFRVYGKSAVMEQWETEVGTAAHEVGLIGEAVAETQEMANALMNMAHLALLHSDYPGRLHTTGNVAFPYSPSDIECGAAYQFNVWHLLELDDPLDACSVEVVEL
jgi:hypothetical protein